MNAQLDPTTRQQLAQAANNCLITLDPDGVLTILIDTRRNLGPSASGKTTIIASTGAGEKLTVGGKQATVGLNVYIKLPTLRRRGKAELPPCLPALAENMSRCAEGPDQPAPSGFALPTNPYPGRSSPMSYLPQPYQPDDSFSIVPPEEALTTIVDELAAVQQEVSDLLISLGHPDLPAKTVTAMRSQLEVAQTALAEARKQGRKAITILAAITVQERRS